MKKLKTHFKFNKHERSGIFFLLLIIVLLQIGFFLYRSFPNSGSADPISLDEVTQAQIDAMKKKALQKDTFAIYPFNPNYISDHKGYTLGMSVDEIDRLHAFRKRNKFINSPKEFQKVTKVSDSLLSAISPYFKFPEWTQKTSGRSAVDRKRSSGEESSPPFREGVGQAFSVYDLNTATAEDLKIINGIGDKLSARIVKFRNRLGGFLVDEQLYDVYGLESDVVKRALKKFRVLNPPKVNKININTASAEEISTLVYVRNHVAENIVAYRSLNGTINSFDELLKIEDFPNEKIARIALYLSLK